MLACVVNDRASTEGLGARPSVADCLRLDPLSAGTLVAGTDAQDDREVGWVSVIEWPVEDFVTPGELVLTTGIGCNAARFEQLAGEVAAAEAAALCVSVGERAPFPAVPEQIRRLGDRLEFPVIALPWDIRFADVSRVVIDRLLASKYSAALGGRDRLPSELTDALLHQDGLQAITRALEGMIERPVLVLDGGLGAAAWGALAAERLGTERLAAQATVVQSLESAARRRLRAALEAGEDVAIEALATLDLPPGQVVAAEARGATVGYVIALDQRGDGPLLEAERQALEQAATAVAIETLRRRAAVEAEARTEGDFLWQLVSAELSNVRDLGSRALLLGYDPDGRYRVMVVEDRGGTSADGAGVGERLNDAHAALRQRGAVAGLRAVRRGASLLVVLPEAAAPGFTLEELARDLDESLGTGTLSWAVADGACSLLELGQGWTQARRAADVGRALRGEGGVFAARELTPFLMLGTLAEDPHALREARAILEPLLRYDAETSRGLLHTLDVYLDENGNTSSAARRLHLNRHSLLYRLRKIESLTGRALERHEDRFLLDLSLHLHRVTGP
jgi:purine catabolism regulator